MDSVTHETQPPDTGAVALAQHLEERRAAILNAWHEAVVGDPRLAAASRLTRTQFNDHIPELLKIFSEQLRVALDATADGESHLQNAEVDNAAEHGLHRWQQGYDIREVVREWGHLHICLLTELERFESAHPGLSPHTAQRARRALAQVIDNGIDQSVAQYHDSQQAEAASHVHDLEEALAELSEWERVRGEVLRTVAHDLRGGLSVVQGAASLLQHVEQAKGGGQDIEPLRIQTLGMVERGVASLHNMLRDLTDLARLEAGHETRNIAPFDAAALLRDISAAVQPLATQRRLYLETYGPENLPVQGDPLKTQRIAQNLLLNALKYTQHGGITVSWEVKDDKHWQLNVQDTGPGLEHSSLRTIVSTLEKASSTAREVEGREAESRRPASDEKVPTNSARTVSSGEGIGLSIVKRLCEMLDAALELETQPGTGSTFRVVFPLHYDELVA